MNTHDTNTGYENKKVKPPSNRRRKMKRVHSSRPPLHFKTEKKRPAECLLFL
jgi:hypothetical protein